MKTGLFVAVAVVVVFMIVVGVLAAGWLIVGRQLWAPWGRHMGQGMMGWWRGSGHACAGGGSSCVPGDAASYGGEPEASGQLTIEEARTAIEQYLDGLRYRGLEIDELMEFERNFYAIVTEHDTGIGAMELLVDKSTGAVGPEMGPNMMWNARYGMHGRGMGQASEVNTVGPGEALAIASRWLDSNRPGVAVEEHADPFYGYYTIHTVRDGQIEGMLSVHGATGDVWYHNWHGAFVQMIEEEDAH